MNSRPAWSTRASARTGSKATEKPCLEKLIYIYISWVGLFLFTRTVSQKQNYRSQKARIIYLEIFSELGTLMD